MDELTFEIAPGRRRARVRFKRSLRWDQVDDGFCCKHCRVYVSTASFMSGVQNRNHCPYCLWSRHLDLIRPGDRMAACKALMQPVGLAVKTTYKRYGPGQGELMLIHLCLDCGKISLNRIAADDDPQRVLAVFEGSFRLDAKTQDRLAMDGIRALSAADGDMVNAQLFGHGSGHDGRGSSRNDTGPA